MPPVRVKSRPLPQADAGLRTPSPFGSSRLVRFGPDLPDIAAEDSFRDVVKKISTYVRCPVFMEESMTHHPPGLDAVSAPAPR